MRRKKSKKKEEKRLCLEQKTIHHIFTSKKLKYNKQKIMKKKKGFN